MMSFIFLYKKPLKNLQRTKNVVTGTDSTGRKSFYHRGGGKRYVYFFLDYQRFFFYVPGLVVSFISDSLYKRVVFCIVFANGYVSYQNSSFMLFKGQWLFFGKFVPRILGVTTQLSTVQRSRNIFNLSDSWNKKITVARAPGVSCHLLKKYKNYCLIRLPSGEEKLYPSNSMSVIGVSFKQYNFFFKEQKAGRRRLRGFRPVTRGVAMNPVDHPHGGGEGRTSGGQPSVTPWGVYTKGVKTRLGLFARKKVIVKRRA